MERHLAWFTALMDCRYNYMNNQIVYQNKAGLSSPAFFYAFLAENSLKSQKITAIYTKLRFDT